MTFYVSCSPSTSSLCQCTLGVNPMVQQRALWITVPPSPQSGPKNSNHRILPTNQTGASGHSRESGFFPADRSSPTLDTTARSRNEPDPECRVRQGTRIGPVCRPGSCLRVNAVGVHIERQLQAAPVADDLPPGRRPPAAGWHGRTKARPRIAYCLPWIRSSTTCGSASVWVSPIW